MPAAPAPGHGQPKLTPLDRPGCRYFSMQSSDWFATATFTAYGKLDKEEICFEDGGDSLRLLAKNYFNLGFYDESHLKNFLNSCKILCGYANPPLRISGTIDLTTNTLYPHTIKRSDSNLFTVFFRMKLNPVDPDDDPGCAFVYAGESIDGDGNNWKSIHKNIISRLLHSTLKVAHNPLECCGVIDHGYYVCKGLRSTQPLGLLTNQPKTVLKRPKSRPKRAVNLRKRLIVLTRDNYKCVKCGASPDRDKNVLLHVDHIIPHSRGGSCHVDNLQTLCESCNLGKGNRLEIELVDSVSQ